MTYCLVIQAKLPTPMPQVLALLFSRETCYLCSDQLFSLNWYRATLIA